MTVSLQCRRTFFRSVWGAPQHPTRRRHTRSSRPPPYSGLNTPAPDDSAKSSAPFYFAAGYAGWPKRPSRPFPPPFFSPPSGSFSDPLSTHDRNVGKRPEVNGQMIRGITNGDDAMLASEHLIATNDGVGQWATRERGHAPLWSRLIIHFQALALEEDILGNTQGGGDDAREPKPVEYLDKAYDQAKEALAAPNEWLGTTTTSSALLHSTRNEDGAVQPTLYVTQLGDCAVIVLRMPPSPTESTSHSPPSTDDTSKSPASSSDPCQPQILFTTTEQWHYFDCPRQLGTNSPDTPAENAVLDQIPLQENDIVLTMSDGVTDNLWQHEISQYVTDALARWRETAVSKTQSEPAQEQEMASGAADAHISLFTPEAMNSVATEIVLAARRVAEDPFAASPYMEKAIEEGLAIEGGKLDDISCVAAAVCRRSNG